MLTLPKQNIYRLFLAIAIVHLFIVVGHSQHREGSGESAEDVRLPGHFAKFSHEDVFAAVFQDFDRSTGRVRDKLNEQKQPSLHQARIWRSGGQSYLVVMIDRVPHDEQLGALGLCGNCTRAAPIAVLRSVGDRLELVAKQDDDGYWSSDGEDRSTGYEAFWYSGHDFDIAFDLAPYRLSGEELLIGVRYQHMWIPAKSFSTTLLLYRIEGNRIRKVFENQVVERNWQNGTASPLKMEKTTSVIMSVPDARQYYKLVVVRKTRMCIADWDTYDCSGGSLLNTSRETWHFDGTRFATSQ